MVHSRVQSILIPRSLTMSVAGQGFGQKRPPLYHLIKNILREYPSGQVFKVLDLELLN